MKNLKTIVVGLFAIIASTEITYPNISNEGVIVQTIGDGSIRKQLENATPAQKAKLLATVQAHINATTSQPAPPQGSQTGGVVTQAMKSDDQDAAVDEALQAAGLDDDYAAATDVEIQSVDSQTTTPEPVKPAAHAESTIPTLAVTDNSAEKQAPAAQTPAVPAAQAVHAVEVAHTEQITPAEHTPPATPTAPAAQVPAAQAVHAVEVAHVTQEASPLKQADNVKIVKVYPVYEALCSAIKAIQNSASDMVNYVYSLMTAPTKVIVVNEAKAPAAEVKP